MRSGCRIPNPCAIIPPIDRPQKCTLAISQVIKNLNGVIDQLLHRVIAGRRIAAAMAPHVDTKNPVACRQEVRHLLGPHAAIGRQRMREIDNGRVRPPYDVKVDLASVRPKKHVVQIRCKGLDRAASVRAAV